MSTLTAYTPIPEGAEAVPALWNTIFSVLSDNIGTMNSDVTLNLPSGDTFSLQTNLDSSGRIHATEKLGIGPTPSTVTTAVLTVATSSANSDYIHFADSSGAKSDYLLGSRVGGTADGLNLYDLSGATMIASFSKQSIRFFQNVVGPVFDVGGSLTKTLNAATYGTGSNSTESRIQAAIDDTIGSGASRVYVPANMYPYSASSISFVHTIQMVREGGNWSDYDVRAYGAAGDNVTNDRAAIVAAIAAAGSTPVVFSIGTYRIGSLITVSAGRYLRGDRATLAALSGYTGLALFEVLSDAVVENCVFDGANIPQPTAAWLGIGMPAGSALYITGTNARVEGNTFTRFAGGPIFARSATECYVIRNSFLSNQSYLVDETNALIELFECDRALVVQNSMQTYNWKAVNVKGNGIKVTENATSGGSTGHAAYYSSRCADLLVGNNSHDGRSGRGFGIKGFQDHRGLVIGNSLTNCISGIYIQDSVGAVITGNEVNPTTNYGIIVETTSATTVDCSGVITGNQITGSGYTTALTPVGIFFNSEDTEFGIRGFRVVGNTIKDVGIGIRSLSNTSAIYEDLDITGNSIRAAGNYGLLLVTKSASINNNSFRSCVNPIFVASASGVTSDVLAVSHNKFAQSSGNLIEIGTGFQCRFNQVTVAGNSGESGLRVLLIDLSNSTNSEYIKHLGVMGNRGWDQTNANAFNITFNSTLTGTLEFSHNVARAVGGSNNANFVNGAQVTGGYYLDNDLASVGTPAAMITAGRFTGASPTAVLREAGGGGVGLQLLRASASGFYNFLIAHGFNFNDILEFTPSTAADGTTFSSPALQVRRTGQVDVPTGPFTVTGAATITGNLQVAGAGNYVGVVAGTAIQPSIAYSSESSLGWYRSGVSTVALSYGTLNLSQARLVSIRTADPANATSNAAANEIYVGVGVSNATLWFKSGNTVFQWGTSSTTTL